MRVGEDVATVLPWEAHTRTLGAQLVLPRVPTDLVPRAALLARLEAGLGGKLTLIAAPAGYGKTTLLAAWLRQTSRPAAYLALDEYGADGATFTAALVRALQTLAPDFGGDTLTLLRLPALPPKGYLAATLATEIAHLPEDAVLVLDDYHTLNSSDVDELLTALLRHLPPRLHVVLATRQEPALPIAQLRVRAELVELRAEDLRFDLDETRAFLARSAHGDVPADLPARLMQRTEDWAAGLRLAVLALAGQDGAAYLTAVLDTAERRYLRDFLIDDVLAAQEPATQQFLLATAIFDRFCAPLCEATLNGTIDAGTAPEMLTRLERGNLFLVPLGEGGWYRYHLLFREALRDRLEATSSAGKIVGLHHRASAWLADAGLAEEAVRHALAIGDEPEAAAIVEHRVQPLLDREEWPRLETLLGLLPASLIERRPVLLLARGWVHYIRYQLRAIPPLLDAAATLLDGPASPLDEGAAEALRGEVDALQCAILMLQDRKEQSRDAGWRAWEHLPAGSAYQRGVTAAVLVLVSRALGEDARAADRLKEGLFTSAATSVYSATRMSKALGFAHLASGDLPRLKEVAERACADAAACGQELSSGW